MANTEVNKYDFKKIEKKWQKNWERKKIFQVEVDKSKLKFYNLEMFPYPSGQGLHIGHSLNYTIGDIRARFKRMNGFNVLYPMGYDAFGLPAENAAIKAGIHPKKYTVDAMRNFIQQQKALGLSYDWSKTLKSCDPEYYKWNQFFFLKFLEKNLVYKKKAPVNWCPKCETVLANEQVVNGCCWRHEDTEVETKNLDQWFIKITNYADELLDEIDNLDWPNRIKIMQRNWIGRSEGVEIDFEIEKLKENEKFSIFTTRPDTIFGVTFMVISAQHSRLMEFITEDKKKDVLNFQKKIKNVSEKHLTTGKLDKEGVFTGSYAINPVNNEKVPIYVGNFVVADYGSGMVMAVPAHDQRDYDFAKKYGIEIREVVKSDKGVRNNAYDGGGTLINSDKFNGLDNEKAKKEIFNYLNKKNLARKAVQYKIRDWLISRQRYWGTPIPVVYCDSCSEGKPIPVPEKDLPVKLPDKVQFGKGNPLKTNEKFVNTVCPKCGDKNARRETDTMDTFVDSSWYFMRYPDNKNSKEPFNKKIENYWLPVDTYIGGAEHAVMHLLYARFWTKALRDLGYVNYSEPFKQLFNQGMLHAEDGRKMSKSLGNVINPVEIVNSEGADALRLTLMSFASPDSDTNWDGKVLQGSLKFLNKVYNNFLKIKIRKSSLRIESKLNQIIKLVTEDIENFNYNLAIIKLRELFGSFGNEESKEVLEGSLKLLHPFCPHITEELWERIGNKNFISLASWPVVDESKINEKYEKQEQAVEKLISDINNILNLLKEKGESSGGKIYFYVLPNEKEIYEERLDEIRNRVGKDIFLYSVADKDKYDPENKSKKVKPMKPGIYIE